MAVAVDDRTALIDAGLEQMLKVARDHLSVVVSMSSMLHDRVVVVMPLYSFGSFDESYVWAMYDHNKATLTGQFESGQLATVAELRVALNRQFPDELFAMIFVAGELTPCNHYQEVPRNLTRVARAVTPGWAMIRNLDRLAGAVTATLPPDTRAEDSIRVSISGIANHFAKELAALAQS